MSSFNLIAKRLVAHATMVALIGTQLTGCLTVPSNGDLSGILQTAGQVAAASQGNAEAHAQAVSTMARALGGASSAGSPVVASQGGHYVNPSYTSAEFKRLHARFKQTKAVLDSNPRGYTRTQFNTFTDSMVEMLRYMDAIEFRAEGRAGHLHDKGWQSFYDESLAYAQPDGQSSILMGAQGALAQIGSSQMIAYCLVCTPQKEHPVSRVRPSAPTANLPSISSSGPRMLPKINAEPGEPASGSAAAIRDAVLGDLKKMAQGMAFDQLKDKGTPFLEFAKKQFKSRGMQEIITAIPFVATFVNGAMILKGKNLDGSPMTSLDYTLAGVGLIPVVGNVLSKGGKVAKLIGDDVIALGGTLNDKSAVVRTLQTLGTDTYEQVDAGMQDWMANDFRVASQKFASALPSVSNYLASVNSQL